MSWGSKRKAESPSERMARAEAIMARPTKSQLLDAADDDYERMLLCAGWQDKARADWYDGLRMSIARVVASNDRRWAGYSTAERRHIGERLWESDPRNKELAGAEQMYARWVLTYGERYRAGISRAER